MFCFQCQETAKNQGWSVKGVCGKPEETADLQDLLIYVCKCISVYGEKLKEQGTVDKNAARFTPAQQTRVSNRVPEGPLLRFHLRYAAYRLKRPQCAMLV